MLRRKLVLRREAIRVLTTQLGDVRGGQEPQETGGSQCWCPTADFTLCPACPIGVTAGCP